MTNSIISPHEEFLSPGLLIQGLLASINKRQCIILRSKELSTDEDTIRAGNATEAQAPRVVTRVTVQHSGTEAQAPRVVTRVNVQHNVQKYVPSNAAQFNTLRTG